MTAPAPDAPFSEKMAYYRTQHVSRGVRITHMIGTPVIATGMPPRRSQRKAERKGAAPEVAAKVL